MMKTGNGSVIVIVVGILAILGGLASFFDPDDGAMIIAGAVLLAGGSVSMSITQLSQRRVQNVDENKK